jgi:hypothetical protein
MVRDGRTLRALARRKLIAEPAALHRPKPGQWGRDYLYVDTLASDNDTMHHLVLNTHTPRDVGINGKTRRMKLQYFDGCFFPLVLQRKH